MKFPITRESLQAFDQHTEDAEKKEEDIQKMLVGDVNGICNEVKRRMTEYSRDKKFVWRDLLRKIRVRDYGMGYPTQVITIDEYLPHLVNKLKETFIGCDILADPLKTYIVIDWS